jgi:hypothetical protein
MLGLALVAGAARQAAAQVYDCYYAGTLIVLYNDGTWEAWDVYDCYQSNQSSTVA